MRPRRYPPLGPHVIHRIPEPTGTASYLYPLRSRKEATVQKLRAAWAVVRAAQRIEDPGRRKELLQYGYTMVLVSSARVVLQAERRRKRPLVTLLAASGAVE